MAAKLQENESASQSFIKLYCPWISGPFRVSWLILAKITLFQTGFEHSQGQNGPTWSILVHSALKKTILVLLRSANRAVVAPEFEIAGRGMGCQGHCWFGRRVWHRGALLPNSQKSSEGFKWFCILISSFLRGLLGTDLWTSPSNPPRPSPPQGSIQNRFPDWTVTISMPNRPLRRARRFEGGVRGFCA